MGKGSAPRPFSVDEDTYKANWERAFGKKDEPEKEKEDAQRSP